MSWRAACLYLKPFLYKLLQWMRGDLYLELGLVWVYEWGWVGSVLGRSAPLQWIQWAFQVCRVLVRKPFPKGGDGDIHLLGVGLLLDHGSLSCVWGLLVCLDESLVTPFLLLWAGAEIPSIAQGCVLGTHIPRSPEVWVLKTAYILHQGRSCKQKFLIFKEDQKHFRIQTW